MSVNEHRLRQAFSVGLNIPETDVSEALAYATSQGWDSLAHMTLVAVLEEVFETPLAADDVLELSSYSKARDILSKRGIVF